jgi:DNA-binding XRE family transcriptional regulator
MLDLLTPLDAFMTAEEMTDTALAKAVGRERSTITKIRLGQARPSLELALKIQRLSKNRIMPTDYPPPQKPKRATTETRAVG